MMPAMFAAPTKLLVTSMLAILAGSVACLCAAVDNQILAEQSV